MAFGGCKSITKIEVDSANENYSSPDGNLFNKNQTTLIQYAIGKADEQYIIPGSVTSIGEGSFSWCESLRSVTMGNSVKSIGAYAFGTCSSLISITIPDIVTSIGNGAFYWCESLTSVTIGNGVISIGNGAFYECGSITDVYYTGSGDEWNKISIKGKNECLTNAEIHYNYDFGTVSFNKETNIITVESPEVIQQAELAAALYKEGKLLEMKSKKISIAVGENTIDSLITDYAGADTVKIMVWDSITGMKPLFECCSVDWEGNSKTVYITE